MSRTRTLVSALGIFLSLGLVATLLVLLDSDPAADPAVVDELGARIATFTAAMSAGQEYRPPNPAERTVAARGFGAELGKDIPTNADLERLGFTVADLVDSVTRRPYTLVQNEPGTDRAWGLYLVDRSAPPSLAVEVPHPAFDLRTELFGLDLFRRNPGAVLLVAGAHRRADGSRADVAHEADSVFHVVATGLAGRGLTQVQLHGFDNQSAPGYDVVLSTGATPAGGPAHRLADGFKAAGLDVCRAWEQSCAGLEGNTNVQGQLAETDGTTFLHVEMNRTLREDNNRRADVVTALVDAKLGVA
ncbi:MAG: Conserved putative secreted protein [Amycolatopsis sp.]|jgi:hypothetical protein|uniref:hypothetical protein n=1 Tax=Amycolatopsis sp. TaxID=37632 RepID=UPI00260DE331|nr:hypothetical protein [Amycolatopsis sp.]MCU1681969.1 Conserved putative secreted protein [Amycolatopsis sp.]